MSDPASATVEVQADPPADATARSQPTPVPSTGSKPKRQPRYHVVLWNDDDHTYEYVIAMLRRLFGIEPEKGFRIAEEVDQSGRAVVLTTTREHAELKRDQIHAFGADRLLARSKGSMSASIEPEA